MINNTLLVSLYLLVFSVIVSALILKTQKDQVIFAIGVNLASSLKQLLIILAIGICLTPKVSADSKTHQRSVEKYVMSDVTLINQDANKVRFKNFLPTDKLVVMDFIFVPAPPLPGLSAGLPVSIRGLAQKRARCT